MFGMSTGLLMSGANLQFINQAVITTDGLTTFDFGSFTIPSDGLMIPVFLSIGDQTRSVSSVSIGGTNGTIQETPVGSNWKRAIASRRVSAGSHNVTVTLSGNSGNGTHAVGVFLLNGNKSDTKVASGDSGVGATSTQEVISFDVGEGFAIYGGHVNKNPSVTSWSSATEVIRVTSESRQFVWAYRRTTPATSYVETMSFTGGLDDAFCIGCAWE